MDVLHFEVAKNPDGWIQAVLDFGFLFLVGSTLLLLIFCILLLESSGCSDRRDRRRSKASSAPGTEGIGRTTEEEKL